MKRPMTCEAMALLERGEDRDLFRQLVQAALVD
jgi:hypothetical protein